MYIYTACSGSPPQCFTFCWLLIIVLEYAPNKGVTCNLLWYFFPKFIIMCLHMHVYLLLHAVAHQMQYHKTPTYALCAMRDFPPISSSIIWARQVGVHVHMPTWWMLPPLLFCSVLFSFSSLSRSPCSLLVSTDWASVRAVFAACWGSARQGLGDSCGRTAAQKWWRLLQEQAES